MTAIQRFGSALNVNVHFHTLVAQGVFFEKADGTVGFAPAPEPSDLEVERVLASARRRIARLVARHGIDLERPSEEVNAADPLLLESPILSEIQGAAVLGRVATGPRAGAEVRRVGRDRHARALIASGPLQAELEGFDLHASVAVPAGDRDRLQHLCRYVLRPPVAKEALELSPGGKVLLHLRRPWRDGTRAICFEPTEFLEKIAAMIPKPRINLLVYHGAFAPHFRGRRGAVRAALEGARHPAAAAEAVCDQTDAGTGAHPPPAHSPGVGVDLRATAAPAPQPSQGDAYSRPKYYAWADLLRRTFAIDILACAECGGRLRLLATIRDSAAIEKILRHLDLPVDPPGPAPARSSARLSEALPGFEDRIDPVGDWPA